MIKTVNPGFLFEKRVFFSVRWDAGDGSAHGFAKFFDKGPSDFSDVLSTLAKRWDMNGVHVQAVVKGLNLPSCTIVMRSRFVAATIRTLTLIEFAFPRRSNSPASSPLEDRRAGKTG